MFAANDNIQKHKLEYWKLVFTHHCEFDSFPLLKDDEISGHIKECDFFLDIM